MYLSIHYSVIPNYNRYRLPTLPSNYYYHCSLPSTSFLSSLDIALISLPSNLLPAFHSLLAYYTRSHPLPAF